MPTSWRRSPTLARTTPACARRTTWPSTPAPTPTASSPRPDRERARARRRRDNRERVRHRIRTPRNIQRLERPMSALTEKVAREHGLTSYDDESGVWVCNCGLSIPADLEHMEHVAAVTEAETRAAVAAEIRVEMRRHDR